MSDATPLVVYTAITGTGIRDRLRARVAADRERRGRPLPKFVCFTDREIANHAESLGWEVRPPLWEHEDDPRRTARWHKLNAHLALADYAPSFSLWHDGSHQLTEDPWLLVDRYLGSAYDFATFKHPERTCLYDEAEACVRLRKDDFGVMRGQVARYRIDGYPKHNGLFETSVFLRRHTDKVRDFSDAWWDELKAGSLRDQLSVNYVLRNRKLQFRFMAGHRAKSPYFNFYSHRG